MAWFVYYVRHDWSGEETRAHRHQLSVLDMSGVSFRDVCADDGELCADDGELCDGLSINSSQY